MNLNSLGSLSDGPPSKTLTLVGRLVAERRRHPHLAPSYFALEIAKSPAWHAFPLAAEWIPLKDPDTWAYAKTSTTAEEFVKRQGRGAAGHWSNEISGEWVPDVYTPKPQKAEKRTAFTE